MKFLKSFPPHKSEIEVIVISMNGNFKIRTTINQEYVPRLHAVNYGLHSTFFLHTICFIKELIFQADHIKLPEEAPQGSLLKSTNFS